MKSATVHPGECVGNATQVSVKERDQRVDGFTTSYARVYILDHGGEGAALVEQLSPRMFMGVEDEKRERKHALMAAVDTTLQHGMAFDCVERLRKFVLEGYPGAFRRALSGQPPPRMQSIMVNRKPGVEVVRARFLSVWLMKHFGQLEMEGIVSSNPPATFLSVVTAVPKGGKFRMEADYRTVNQLVGQAPIPIPRLENWECC